MKIVVDADSCPTKEMIEEVAKQYSIEVIMIIDTSHELYSDYSKIIQVSKAPDAVDLALINITNNGDIVVTQDYGVATMALGKKAFAIHTNGKVYTNDNIDRMLFERHISKKQRRAGFKTGNVKKRTKEDNNQFIQNFTSLIQQASRYHDTK